MKDLFLVAFLTKLSITLPEYKSYHTDLILLYKFNSLPEDFRSVKFRTEEVFKNVIVSLKSKLDDAKVNHH